VEVVASLSQGRTAAAQCGLFTHKSVPVTFEPPCICEGSVKHFKTGLFKRSGSVVKVQSYYRYCFLSAMFFE